MAEQQDAQNNEEGEFAELPEDDSSVRENPDGSAVVMLENDAKVAAYSEHFANIVDDVAPSALRAVATDLLEKIERDKEAREKRDKLYEEGIRRTGLGDDAPGGAQFTGATRVVHPMLVEACVDFNARVVKEIFPPGGPVKSKVLGKQEQDKLEKAERKTEFMNWQCTEQMQEFRAEVEQLLTQLPLGGSQYMKFTWDIGKRRPMAEFIPIDDIYLPYAATNFYTAERRTHVQYITEAIYQQRVKSGMYADIDLPMPEEPDPSRAQKANDKVEGREQTSYNEDGLRTVFEVSTRLDIETEGEFYPYVITLDKTTQRVLALYRNWDPEDEQREELESTVEFAFVPWRGAYAIGLTHMIGGLAAASTGALRALLDSAHIQNVPTLLKLKGGANSQTLNIQPTQVVEMEGGALVDDVRKLAMPLPFAGPSPTLFQLLGFLVDAGKGVVQTSFEKLADVNANAPVGTTLALIEQGMVVFSSIHSRLHGSMARCFKILHRLNSSYLTQEDLDSYNTGLEVMPQDFEGPLDVVPVSDPAIFSETQRFAQVQAVQQRAAMMPQLYDARKVEEMFLRTLKLDADQVLVEQPGKDDRDPVSENVAAAMGQPVYVLPQQDHVEHIKLHLAFIGSPLLGSNPAIIKTALYPLATHLRDHVLNLYMSEAHAAIQKAGSLGIQLQGAAQEADLVLNVQSTIEQMLGGLTPILARIDQEAQQYAPKPQMPPDSSLQVAQLNAQVAQQMNAEKTQLAQQQLQQRGQLDAAKLQQDSQQAAAELAQKQEAERNSLLQSQIVQQAEDRRNQESNDTRERMNTADNQTALHITAAEIATNEHTNLRTGTGINPTP